MLFSSGQFEYEAVRPRIGWPMVIPAPNYLSDLASVPFSKCYAENVEGAWVTVHINRPANMATASCEQPDLHNATKTFSSRRNALASACSAENAEPGRPVLGGCRKHCCCAVAAFHATIAAAALDAAVAAGFEVGRAGFRSTRRRKSRSSKGERV